MRSKPILLPLCIGLFALFVSRAHADVTFLSRTSSYNITFSDASAFTDASAAYDVTTVTHADQAGDTLADFINVKSGYTNYKHSAAGDIGISGETFVPGLNRYNYTLTAPTPLSSNGIGTELIHYDTAIGSSFNSSWIVSGTSNGYHTLQFLGGGSVLNTLYPEFDVNVTLQGDWSHMGTTTGTLKFGYVDPAWTILDDFVYNSATNQTTFSAVNQNFSGNGGPNLNFTLYGAPVVPEARSLLSLGGMLVLGGLLTLLHRRSRVQKD